MKKTTNILIEKSANLMNSCALAVAAHTINAACMVVHHQPTVPESAKRLRKF